MSDLERKAIKLCSQDTFFSDQHDEQRMDTPQPQAAHTAAIGTRFWARLADCFI
jgi:hypothetical protein